MWHALWIRRRKPQVPWLTPSTPEEHFVPKRELIFVEGCFDDFDGTQEELDRFVADIKRMFETGELTDGAEPIDEDEWDSELHKIHRTRH